MAKINLLTEDIINKIAAGEVIERPASVVKELIENSIDAKATKIHIDIQDSGKKQIKIKDNGEGMDEPDAQQSILRHATSKIQNVDDLFSIHTLGFRGEALASIAAVSQLSIITKPAEKEEGYNLVVEGGRVISSGILAAETGTTIEVRNLFFNTPARKKFLKTDQVELRHIIDIVTRYALIHPTISFRLSHEGHILLNSASVDNLQNNLASIYGTDIAKDMLEVNYTTPDVAIYGYIGKPHLARNDKSQQSLYINHRWIKSEELSMAIYDAYHSLLFVNKHPILVLNLELDPHQIDVNVHPHKSEVKIEQIQTVKNALFTSIKETLQKNNLIPLMDFQFEQQLTFGIPQKEFRTERREARQEAKYAFEPSYQTLMSSSIISAAAKNQSSTNLTANYDAKDTITTASSFEISEDSRDERNISNEENISDEESIFDEENTSDNSNSLYENIFLPEYHAAEELPGNIKLPPMKILGQVHKTFFIAETEGGMLIIDQHVVQERVLYEKFMSEYLNKRVAVQTLLKGELIELSSLESIAVQEHLSILASLGFRLEEFGENTYILKTIPSVFGRTQATSLFRELLNSLISEKNILEEIQEEIITRMACRASVKAGDVMTIIEIKNLLNELSRTKLPYTCPHGRSVLIKLNVDELEKKFRRK